MTTTSSTRSSKPAPGTPNAALEWKLEEIYPTYGDLLSNLDWLFDNHDRVRRHYKTGIRYHRGQVLKFSRQAREQGKPWIRRAAYRLFAIRKRHIDLAIALRKEYRDDRAWIVQNCRPSGGKWTCPVFHDTPVGKQCHSPVCFFCWLRRFNDLWRLISKPLGEEVTMVSSFNRKRPALGMGAKNLRVTRFVCYDNEAILDSRSVFNCFQYRVKKLTRKAYVEDRDVDDETDVKEFSRAIRLTSPVFVEGRIGFQIAFIHQGPSLKPDRFGMKGSKTVSGLAHAYRHGGLALGDALRLAFPFPVWLFDGMSDAAVYVTLRKLRKLRLRTMGDANP